MILDLLDKEGSMAKNREDVGLTRPISNLRIKETPRPAWRMLGR